MSASQPSRRAFLRHAAATSLLVSPLMRAAGQAEAPSEATRLPIFPLPVVAYPGEHVPLHIYEPRYRELMADCRANSITFGISTFVAKRIAPYGTEMELLEVAKEYDDGRLDVVTRGTRVYEIKGLHEQIEGKLYPGADVSYPGNDTSIGRDEQADTLKLYRKICSVWSRPYQLPDELPENLSYVLAHIVALTLEQQVHLLGVLSESERQGFLREHMKSLLESHEPPEDKGSIA